MLKRRWTPAAMGMPRNTTYLAASWYILHFDGGWFFRYNMTRKTRHQRIKECLKNGIRYNDDDAHIIITSRNLFRTETTGYIVQPRSLWRLPILLVEDLMVGFFCVEINVWLPISYKCCDRALASHINRKKPAIKTDLHFIRGWFWYVKKAQDMRIISYFKWLAIVYPIQIINWVENKERVSKQDSNRVSTGFSTLDLAF